MVSGRRIRMTTATWAVLQELASSPDDDPAWGWRICRQAQLLPGTVYPVLDRLLAAGWITAREEKGRPSSRPPRRYFRLTAAGRRLLAEASDERRARLDRVGRGGARRA